MTLSKLLSAVETGLPALFECSLRPRGDLHVRTPLYRPDGDGVDLFVAQHDDGAIVTDYGDTLGWLFSAAGITNLSDGQRAWVDDVNLMLGTQMHKGQLSTTCRDPDDLADAIMRVAQASIRIADLAMAPRPGGIDVPPQPALAQPGGKGD